MTVNHGHEREYERRHQPIWPELEDVLRQHGVLTYSIFLDAETNELFGYVEVESDEQWAAIGTHRRLPALVALHARHHAVKSGRESHLA